VPIDPINAGAGGAATGHDAGGDAALLRLLLSRIDGANGFGVKLGAHLMTLYALARRATGPIVECGVGSGYSTLALLAGALEAGVTLESYDVKAEARDAALSTWRFDDADPRLAGWTFVQKSSEAAAADWAGEPVSLLFLDTSHFYTETRRELEAWAPRMRADGVLCGHDYLLHLDPLWTATGVKRAVDEFVAADGRYTLQVIQRDHGLFILWPASAGASTASGSRRLAPDQAP
jgi:predicted O-methyltransferase YrrM